MKTAVSVRYSAYVGVSLDGFIARKDGDIDWLTAAARENPNEDHGYQAFMDSVDTLVLGRSTYELAVAFKEWPYTGKNVVVLSTGSPKVPEGISGNVQVMSCSPAELDLRLSKNGAHYVYVDGGKTIREFLAAGLLDNLTITRIPILLGEGLPLFGRIHRDIRLEHLETKSYASGFVQSKYRPLYAA